MSDTLIKPGYRLCGGRPSEVDGVIFRPYSTGILRYARITDDGQISVWQNHRSDTYTAEVIGAGPILGPSGKPKRYRSQKAAMQSAIDLFRKMQGEKAIPS